MRNHCHLSLFLVVSALVISSSCITADVTDAVKPESFILSWQDDPARTMTIDWHTAPEAYSFLEYREKGTKEWLIAHGDLIPVPDSDNRLYRRELRELKPDQLYEFRFGGQKSVYNFLTMPESLNRPIRFVASGDMMHNWEWTLNTAQSVMKVAGEEIDFAVIGGDLAYADGDPERLRRWFRYFDIWSTAMITKNNRVIPHIAAIGNHEVKRGYIYRYQPVEYQQPDFARREAPYYTTFIPFPGEAGYGVLDFGDYLSLFILDSDHLNFVDEEQADWLSVTMQQRRDGRHLVPVYHVTAYPSARSFDGRTESAIRENWVPVFEDNGVRLALENHDHTYKRTHPIRDGQIDETGIYFVGDGAWGVRTRVPRTDEDGNWPWYIANADSIRHFIMVEINRHDLFLEMYDEDGRFFDQLHIPAL